MEIDQKIETPMGVVHFKGTLSDTELQEVIKAGLMLMLAKEAIQANVQYEDDEPTDGNVH